MSGRNKSVITANYGEKDSLVDSYNKFNVRTDPAARETIYSTLIALLENDRHIVNACSELAKELRKRGMSSKIIAFFDDITRRTEMYTFEQAVRGWVPDDESMLITSASASGDILGGIREALTLLRNNLEISKAVTGAVIGPAMMLVALFGLLAVISMGLLPILLDLAPLEVWPKESKPFYYFAEFVNKEIVFILIAVGAFITVVSMSLSRATGKARYYLDSIPPWSLSKRITSSVFLNSLAAVIEQNVTPLQALEMIKANGSKYLKWHIDKMVSHMSTSGKPGDAITSTKLFNPEVAAIISCVAGDGDFAEKIRYIAIQETRGVLLWAKSLSSIFNVIMLIVIALTLMWSLGSILYAIWTFYITIQAEAWS